MESRDGGMRITVKFAPTKSAQEMPWSSSSLPAEPPSRRRKGVGGPQDILVQSPVASKVCLGESPNRAMRRGHRKRPAADGIMHAAAAAAPQPPAPQTFSPHSPRDSRGGLVGGGGAGGDIVEESKDPEDAEVLHANQVEWHMFEPLLPSNAAGSDI